MDESRQKTEREKASISEGKGETQRGTERGTEASKAKQKPEEPVANLMEVILGKENLKEAVKTVVGNKGAPGIDGLSVESLIPYLAANWSAIKKALMEGTYKPKPVRRVEIPKSGGGKRKLGIPSVLDRTILQAILQVLQPLWDPTFSENSYGFRRGRSQHNAVDKAQEYIRSGLQYVVDLDLEKFFDRVNHDVLMSRVAKRVTDKRLLKLLRAYLNAGMMEEGLVQPTTEGMPQGSPLSPLLSNLLLDELDKELEKRNLKFVRYADDCNIYVSSQRAGLRVKESITEFLESKLKLKVNEEKSAVGKPWTRKFLGFSFTKLDAKKRIARQSIQKAMKRIRELTRRGKSSFEAIVKRTSKYLNGWLAYFGHAEKLSSVPPLFAHARRRLRRYAWKEWKTTKNRRQQLIKRGVDDVLACKIAGGSIGPWHTSQCVAMSFALPNSYFSALGIPTLEHLRH